MSSYINNNNIDDETKKKTVLTHTREQMVVPHIYSLRQSFAIYMYILHMFCMSVRFRRQANDHLYA